MLSCINDYGETPISLLDIKVVVFDTTASNTGKIYIKKYIYFVF